MVDLTSFDSVDKCAGKAFSLRPDTIFADLSVSVPSFDSNLDQSFFGVIPSAAKTTNSKAYSIH